MKTLVALQYAVNFNTSDYEDDAVQLALAGDALVTVRHSGLSQAIVAFQVSSRAAHRWAMGQERSSVPAADVCMGAPATLPGPLAVRHAWTSRSPGTAPAHP